MRNGVTRVAAAGHAGEGEAVCWLQTTRPVAEVSAACCAVHLCRLLVVAVFVAR
jgi:hypothetical protein